MTADQLRALFTMAYRAGFIEACQWTEPVSQDVDSHAFYARLEKFIEEHTPMFQDTRPAAVASHAEGEVVAIVGEAADAWKIVAYGEQNTGWIPPGDKIKTAFFLKDVPIGTKLYTHPLRSGDEAERTVKENLTVDDEARDAAYWKDRAHAAEDKIASQSLMDVCRQCDECAPYLKEDETPVQRIERERKDVTACLRLLQVERTLTDIDRLVDRFLAWPLPSSVCPDGCVMNRDYPYRVGTNLLTADEAKAMFIHALGRDDAMAARGEK